MLITFLNEVKATYYFSILTSFWQLLVPELLGSNEVHITARKIKMLIGIIFPLLTIKISTSKILIAIIHSSIYTKYAFMLRSGKAQFNPIKQM